MSKTKAIQSSQAFQFGYCPELDGVRAYAILLVMMCHSPLGLMTGGFLGVDLFFVLSGFLITVLLLQEYRRNGAIDLNRFYLRRLLRLAPALLLVATSVGLYELAITGQIPFHEILPALFYSGNWLRASEIGVLGLLEHTWSLAMEAQFYVLWPPVLVLMLKRGWKESWISRALLACIVAVFVLRNLMVVAGATPDRLFNGLDTRGDSLLAGCLLAVVLHNRRREKLQEWQCRIAPLAVGSAIFLGILTRAATWNDLHFYIGTFSVVAAAAGSLIAWIVLSDSPIKQFLFGAPWLVGIGRISYGLYLWHYPIFHVFDSQVSGQPNLARFLAKCALVFLVAVISYYTVERPLLSIRIRRSSAVPHVHAEAGS